VSPPSSTGRPPSPLSSARLARPPSGLGQHGHSHIHLHLLMSQMSATAADHPASWSLGPSLTSALHHFRSIGTARLYLTFTPPSTTVSEHHTCTTQAKRHVAHIAFVMIGLVITQPFSWITLTITHHKTKHKGTFQPRGRNLCIYIGQKHNRQ
jgi:L-lactate permease